jgi:hypothetical protein
MKFYLYTKYVYVVLVCYIFCYFQKTIPHRNGGVMASMFPSNAVDYGLKFRSKPKTI